MSRRPRRGRASPSPTATRALFPPPEQADLIGRLYGTSWLDLSGQALVWAMLLVEIPRQIQARYESRRAWLEELEQRDPASPLIPEMRAALQPPMLGCEIDQKPAALTDCIVAIVAGWPSERRVDFAMSRQGNLHVRCVNVPKKLPAIVTRPTSIEDAHKTARELVFAAIDLVEKG